MYKVCVHFKSALCLLSLIDTPALIGEKPSIWTNTKMLKMTQTS